MVNDSWCIFEADFVPTIVSGYCVSFGSSIKQFILSNCLQMYPIAVDDDAVNDLFKNDTRKVQREPETGQILK